MRFEITQSVAASRDLVEVAFADPAFYEALTVTPNLAVRGVPDRVEVAGGVELSVRFAFTGNVSSAVRAVVDPAKLTWLTIITIPNGEHTAEFRMQPDHYADRLRCSGSYRFDEVGASTKQTMSGNLSVSVPLFGRTVEKAIISGLTQHLADEAKVLATWKV